MKKRLIALIMAVVLIAALLPVNSLAEEAEGHDYASDVVELGNDDGELDERKEISSDYKGTPPFAGETVYTSPSDINGQMFTSSSTLATKLTSVFTGSAQLFANTTATYQLGSRIDNSYQYYVGPGSGSISGWQCYIYANGAYYYLFGDIPCHGTLSYCSHSRVVLSNVTVASYETFDNAGVRVGAYIRTTPNTDGSYNGNSGHSLLVLSYNQTYIYTLEGNYDGNGLVCATKMTWAQFNSIHLAGHSGRRIAHILQPTDDYYSSLGDAGSYISQCTPYHCYATVTAKANAKLWTLPCSSSTDSSSVNEVNCSSSGENLTATLMYKNTKDNYWYRVTKNNKTYYLYAGNVTNVSLLWDVTASNISAPSSITEGSYYSLQGTISTSKLKLCYVSSYVYSGSATSGTAVTGGEVSISASSYSLYNSTLDSQTLFNILSPGTYTLVFRARATNNYSTNGTSMQTYTRPLSESTVYTKQFTVTSSAPTSYDLTLSTNHIYKYLYDSSATTVTCTYTASKTSLTMSYSIGDTSVCTCSWGSWNGNSCPLYVYPAGVGDTTITVKLKNYDTGEVYDTQYITVSVDGDPWMTASVDYIYEPDDGNYTTEVILQHAGYLPNGVTLSASVGNSSICYYSWGDWFGDRQLPIYITTKGNVGSTTVTVKLLDLSTNAVLATVYITVEVYSSLPSLNEALNYGDGSINFSTGSDYPFFVEMVGSWPSGISGNGGVANSESYITARVLLRDGDCIGFDYICSTEANYDLLNFYANDELIFQTSGESNGWQHYNYYPETSGYYTLKWSYTKDSSVNSGDDRVVIDDVLITYGDWNPSDLNNALNYNDIPSVGRLRFFTEGSFYADNWYGSVVGSSFNFGEANSVSAVETSVWLDEGDELWYSYYFSTESNYDWFNVYMNGEQYTHVSGELGSWQTTYFYAPYSGYFTFRWEYTKDSSVNNGLDCVKLRDIYVWRSNYVSLNEAMNAEGSYLDFTTGGDYPFYVYRDTSDGTYMGSSSNFDVANSTSYVETEAYLNEGDQLKITLGCLSEESYDIFRIYINGELLYEHSGIDEYWHIITCTAVESGYRVFRFEYVKDGSVNASSDRVLIKNAHIVEAEPDYLLGDVDGDGNVSSNDALLALRFAMGLISLNEDQIMRGDVDGNGTITSNDALSILRYAMGLISSLRAAENPGNQSINTIDIMRGDAI